jgi:hypothetical protein
LGRPEGPAASLFLTAREREVLTRYGLVIEWDSTGTNCRLGQTGSAASSNATRTLLLVTVRARQVRVVWAVMRSARVVVGSAPGCLSGNDKIERAENTRIGAADCWDCIHHPGGGGSGAG